MLRFATSSAYRGRLLVGKSHQPLAAVAASRRYFDSDSNRKAVEEAMSKLSPPRRKLFNILSEYRKANYSHCVPSRFLKTIVDAVDANNDGVITIDEYQTLLKNIGAEDKLTKEDLDSIFEEVGEIVEGHGDEKVIRVTTLKEKWKPFLKLQL